MLHLEGYLQGIFPQHIEYERGQTVVIAVCYMYCSRFLFIYQEPCHMGCIGGITLPAKKLLVLPFALAAGSGKWYTFRDHPHIWGKLFYTME
jgi:hypothetical protein